MGSNRDSRQAPPAAPPTTSPGTPESIKKNGGHMIKEELQKELQNLIDYTIDCLSDLQIDSNYIHTLYEKRKFIRFKIYNYNKIKEMNLQQIQDYFQLYLKASKQRTSLKSRIKKKVQQMIKPAFITITFTDYNFTINYKNELRKLFKKYNINHYHLITDYGAKTQRLHFHGFIDVAYLDANLFEQTIKGKYFNFIPLNRFGHNVISYYGDNINRMINYATKYMLKDPELNHTSFSSRNGYVPLLWVEEQRKKYLKDIQIKNYFNFITIY
jgi:hypothetical protein